MTFGLPLTVVAGLARIRPGGECRLGIKPGISLPVRQVAVVVVVVDNSNSNAHNRNNNNNNIDNNIDDNDNYEDEDDGND